MQADSSVKLIVHAQQNSLSITEINFFQCLKAETILRPLKAIFLSFFFIFLKIDTSFCLLCNGRTDLKQFGALNRSLYLSTQDPVILCTVLCCMADPRDGFPGVWCVAEWTNGKNLWYNWRDSFPSNGPDSMVPLSVSLLGRLKLEQMVFKEFVFSTYVGHSLKILFPRLNHSLICYTSIYNLSTVRKMFFFYLVINTKFTTFLITPHWLLIAPTHFPSPLVWNISLIGK